MIALFCACLRDGDGRGLGGDVNVTHCLNVGTWSPTPHSHPSPPPFSVLLIVIVFQTLPSVPQPSASGLEIIPGPILILISPFPIQGESLLTIHRGATPRD